MEFAQFILWGLFSLIWLILWVVYRNTPIKNNLRIKSYNYALYITGPLSLVAYFSQIGKSSLSFAHQQEVGVMLTFLGLVFASFSRFKLKEKWSLDACASEESGFIAAFPYSLVRHPIYAGQIVMCAGTSLTSKNILFFLTFFCGNYILLRRRALVEERVLNQATKGRYMKRLGHIGRFFPRIQQFVR
jgi:protein-S-isoprenylcysteine O-methyltransferase Ste14